ncbi:MAG: glycosyltransferase family 4 protein, partial [Campylobacter sp.]|nr:glycosyltransferase family 4 protein [Campylobacter sp.]
LFKIGDFDELAKKLEKLMSSDELIDSLVKNANMSLDEFRVENIYKKWESFINKTVNKPLKKDKK